jgi:hypothetical protein
MRISPARPAPLVLGFLFVSVLAWQAWGAFTGDGLPVAGVTGGGGFASAHPYGHGGAAGQATVGRSTGNGFELQAGLWAAEWMNPVRTDVDEPLLRPQVHRLIGAYPNPFNPRTEVRFELAEATRVRVDVHDIRGRLIRTLVDETRSSGPHAVVWNGTDNRGVSVASGTYFLRFAADDRVETRKVALLK